MGQYTYKNGQVEYYYHSALDTIGGEIELLSRQVYTFSDNGKYQQIIVQYLNPKTKIWFDRRKDLRRFDDSKNLVAYESYKKRENDWIPIHKVTSTYNAENLKEWDSTFIYNENGECNSGVTSHYSYNSLGLVKKRLDEAYDDRSCTPIDLLINTYNGAFRTQSIRYWWEGKDWVLSSLDTFFQEGNKVIQINQDASGNLVLTNKLKIVTYLNNIGLDSLRLVSRWIDTNNVWEKSSRTKNRYNQKGLCTEEIIEKWDSTKYINNQKRVSEYTSDLLIRSKRNYLWDRSEWKKTNVWYADYKPTSQIEALLSKASKKNYKDIHFSSDFISAPKEAKELYIYNLQGRLIWQVSAQQEAGKNRFALPEGIAKAPYVLRFIDVKDKSVGAPIVHSFN